MKMSELKDKLRANMINHTLSPGIQFCLSLLNNNDFIPLEDAERVIKEAVGEIIKRKRTVSDILTESLAKLTQLK